MANDNTTKVALITGGALRIGAAIAQAFHSAGWQVMIHCHTSVEEADQLCTRLNQQKVSSADFIQADLLDPASYSGVIAQTINKWGRMDALVNNASQFLPSHLGSITHNLWQQMMTVNVQASFFLSQEAFPYLRASLGSIVNITDTHADGRPIKDYAVYSISKAALLMQTQALAREFAPYVRVNAVAPGVSMWDMNDLTPFQEEILDRTPLRRAANTREIAKAVMYLVNGASYTTGSTVYVDGGRSLYN